MRLINYSEDDASGGGGGEAEKKQQSFGPSKRGRSSLDYKVRNVGNMPLTTTKPGKRQSRRQVMEEQQARDAAAAQEQNRIPTKSRARGGGGPPPRRWDISDLGNMNEDELLQALYADPTLAQNLVEATEKMATGGEKPPKTTTTSAPAGAKKSRRSPPGGKKTRKEFSEYPEHLKELVDGGVPVFQWVILLVLLGVALYQLRKILTLPDVKEPQRGKSKGVKGKKGKATTPDVKAALVAVEETLRAIDIDGIVATPPKNGTTKAAKKAAPPSKKKKKATTNPASSTKKNDSLDVPVGGEEKDSAAARLTLPLTAPIQAAVTNALEDHDGGWQMVSKDAKPPTETAPISTETKSNTGLPPEKRTTTSMEVSRDTPTATVQKDDQHLAVVDATTASNDSKKENTPPPSASSVTLQSKKKKKKKPKGEVETETETGSDPVEESPSAIESIDTAINAEAEPKTINNDEALAQQLQREEDKFAQAATTNGSQETTANEWEEVTTRKRKGNKVESDVA